jgi:hypothetical protein
VVNRTRREQGDGKQEGRRQKNWEAGEAEARAIFIALQSLMRLRSTTGNETARQEKGPRTHVLTS